MPWEVVVLLVPSTAAALELPRRIAAGGRALAGVYALTVRELARRLAEPALLGRGLHPWDAGHGALLTARLLAGEGGSELALPPGAPRALLAGSLARTFAALRLAGAPPDALDRVRPAEPDDVRRVRAVGRLYRSYVAEVEARFADPATVLRAAAAEVPRARWLQDATVLVPEPLELEPLEAELVAAVARLRPVQVAARVTPRVLQAVGLPPGTPTFDPALGLLAAVSGQAAAASLRRLRLSLFEPLEGEAATDDAVEIVTGAGEAAEVRALVRRLLREAARGVPFEDMAILLPRPETYAGLVTDLLDHAGVPWRLHPSLPLRTGRASRSLLLLLRCRGLRRDAVMEFLTFARVPFAEMLGEDAQPRPAAWDGLSREAGVVRGFESWIIGLRAYAESQEELAAAGGGERGDRALRRAREAEALLRVVELLAGTLDSLSGDGSWPEWSARLQAAAAAWIGTETDRERLGEVLADLGGLGSVSGPSRVGAAEMETVLEARLEWERQPLRPLDGGAVHLGSFEALAGVPFRVVAIPGLVEGSYPGVMRPDPFLLDAEREALARPVVRAVPRPARQQLSLFDPEPERVEADPSAPPLRLPTSQDRLHRARRDFHRALAQATERLVLSYPRSDARSGRERLPSLFLLAAASTLAGRPLNMAEMQARTVEDALDTLDLDLAVDAGERDLARIRRQPREAPPQVAAGSPFFRRARNASSRRWSGELTEYDGHLVGLPAPLRRGLDLLTREKPVSASALGAYGQCGFLYLLRQVLRIEPLQEPEERIGLDALERGTLFHEVAELFLREKQAAGELPLRDVDAHTPRLHDLALERVNLMVKTRPPRFRLLWDLEWEGFLDLLDRWLAAEVRNAGDSTPLAFEVGFGLPVEPGHPGPHLDEPIPIDLGDGVVLRVAGRIDRIDEQADGALVLRDYKTGQRPKTDVGLFRGGRQLQMPFYVLAARRMFPGRKVAHAFLDFVGSGPIRFDPDEATGERLQHVLRLLTGVIGEGVFAQEASGCKWCDFTAVCGPAPLLELRRSYKRGDEVLRRVEQVREVR